MDSGPSLTKIRAQIRNNDFSYTVNFEGGTVFNSIWHSVVFRRNGTNFHIFVDGVIAGTFSGTPHHYQCNRSHKFGQADKVRQPTPVAEWIHPTRRDLEYSVVR